MTAQKGSSLLLKAEATAGGGTYTTIAGQRSVSIAFNSETVDVTTKDTTDKWRRLLEGAGICDVAISASCVFDDASIDDVVRTRATSPTDNIWNFQVIFPNSDTLSGAFQVTGYTRTGDYNGAEMADISLASAGAMTYTAA